MHQECVGGLGAHRRPYSTRLNDQSWSAFDKAAETVDKAFDDPASITLSPIHLGLMQLQCAAPSALRSNRRSEPPQPHTKALGNGRALLAEANKTVESRSLLQRFDALALAPRRISLNIDRQSPFSSDAPPFLINCARCTDHCAGVWDNLSATAGFEIFR